MQCQLGRIMRGEEELEILHLGKLVWVVAKPPEGRGYYDYAKGLIYLNPMIFPHFKLCYFGVNHPALFLAHAKNIELLPYFKEREPTSWDEWLGEGGESIPDEKTETAVS